MSPKQIKDYEMNICTNTKSNTAFSKALDKANKQANQDKQINKQINKQYKELSNDKKRIQTFINQYHTEAVNGNVDRLLGYHSTLSNTTYIVDVIDKESSMVFTINNTNYANINGYYCKNTDTDLHLKKEASWIGWKQTL